MSVNQNKIPRKLKRVLFFMNNLSFDKIKTGVKAFKIQLQFVKKKKSKFSLCHFSLVLIFLFFLK